MSSLKNRTYAVAALPIAALYPIAFSSLTEPKKPAAAPTYSQHVAKILFDRCATCHRPGEVAPFSLLTFADTKKRAKQIAQVVQNRFMPPWKADSHGEFLNERRLTQDEILTVTSWASAGAPEGDRSKLPAQPKFNANWALGEPNMVAQLPEKFKLDAEGKDVYRCFVIPMKSDVSRWLAAMEVRPDNRKVVHHVIAYLDTSGTARKLDEKDPGPGYGTSGGGPGFIPSAFLGGWAPGNDSGPPVPGLGMEIPKDADLVLEMHYNKSGKAEEDQTRVGLHWAKGPVKQRLRIAVAINPVLHIPADAKDHVVRATTPITADSTVLGITPHMHLLGKSMKLDAVLPDGKTISLVNVNQWDFNWQTLYMYKQPIKLPAGSKVTLEARYDNSSGNPYNPNRPPKDVRWGEQTSDEMCIAFLALVADAEDLTKGKRLGRVSPYEIGLP